MIRTKKEVIINALEGVKGVVYLQGCNPVFIDDKDIVQTDVIISVLVSETVQVPNGSGILTPTIVNRLKVVNVIKPIFKRSTWDALMGGVTKSQYDQKLIDTIAFVNNKEVTGTWNGNEVQRISYWAKEEFGGITGNDLEIVTEAMLNDLNVG